MYEYARLSVDPKYSHYRYTDLHRRYPTLTREKRPLDEADRLHVVRLRHESPMDLLANATSSAAAAGAIWAVAQTVEKVWNIPLNRSILMLEQRKLQKELSDSNSEFNELPSEEVFKRQLKSHGLDKRYEEISGRLQKGAVRVKEIEVDVTHLRDFLRRDY